jgi:hypothetical protein
VRTGPSSDDAHAIVFFQRHEDDDPNQRAPGRQALDSYPASVRAKVRAALVRVATAPPKRFDGGGYWTTTVLAISAGLEEEEAAPPPTSSRWARVTPSRAHRGSLAGHHHRRARPWSPLPRGLALQTGSDKWYGTIMAMARRCSLRQVFTPARHW